LAQLRARRRLQNMRETPQALTAGTHVAPSTLVEKENPHNEKFEGNVKDSGAAAGPPSVEGARGTQSGPAPARRK
jgi:hypothetical protein